MVKRELLVEEMKYGEGQTEMLKVLIRRKEERRDFAVVYVPLKTKWWNRKEHENIKDTKECLVELTKQKKWCVTSTVKRFAERIDQEKEENDRGEVRY